MRTHTLLFSLLFILITQLTIKCSDPASVEEINNPGSVRPQITLTKTVNNSTGQSNAIIKAVLRNQDDEIVEIDDGNIFVNNLRMDPPENYFFGESRNYYQKVIPLYTDSLYIFEIRFSNGSEAYAWIETPEVELSQINMPLEHKRNTDLTVEWIDIDFRYPQSCIIKFWDKEEGFEHSNQKVLMIHDPFLGEYTISGKYLIYRNESEEVTNETRIIIRSETDGVIESSFLNGGYIRSYFKIYQDAFMY